MLVRGVLVRSVGRRVVRVLVPAARVTPTDPIRFYRFEMSARAREDFNARDGRQACAAHARRVLAPSTEATVLALFARLFARD
jgi:hypothetical protein